MFALQLVGQFIARAVSDQILSESYIDGYKGRVNCEYARYVIYLFSSLLFDFCDRELHPYLFGIQKNVFSN